MGGPTHRPARERLNDFWTFSALTGGARLVIAALVGLFVTVEVVGAVLGVTDEPAATTVVQVALTLSFLVFLWHPPAGALVLQVGALISVALGAGEAAAESGGASFALGWAAVSTVRSIPRSSATDS